MSQFINYNDNPLNNESVYKLQRQSFKKTKDLL